MKTSIEYLKKLILLTAFILLPVAAWGEGLEIFGSAELNQPLVGASIIIKDINGQVIHSEDNATGSYGAFCVHPRNTIPKPGGYIFDTRQGKVEGVLFGGTMRALIENYNGEAVIINPFTTLIANYAFKNHGVDKATAALAIGRLFGNRLPTQAAFLEGMSQSGQNFDSYIESLVTMAQNGEQIVLPEHTGQEQSVKFVLEKTVKMILEEKVGKLLNIVSAADDLDKIREQLKDIEKNLYAISSQMEINSQELESILGRITDSEFRHGVMDGFARIDALSDKLLVLSRIDDKQTAIKLANEIFESTKTMADLLDKISRSIVPQESASNSAFHAYATKYSDALEKGRISPNENIDVKQTMSDYRKLYAAFTLQQLRGIVLYSEWMHRNCDDNKFVKDQLKKQLEKHHSSMKKQVDLFLEGNEMLASFLDDPDADATSTDELEVVSAFAIDDEQNSSYGSFPVGGAIGGGRNPSAKYIQVVFTNTTNADLDIRIFNNVNDFTSDIHNVWLDENGRHIIKNDYITIPAGRSYTLRLQPKTYFRKGHAFNYITKTRTREGLTMTHESRFAAPENPSPGKYYADGSTQYSLAKSPCFFAGTEKKQFSDFIAQKVTSWLGITSDHPIFEKTIKKLSEALTKALNCNYTETINYYSVVFTDSK